jgi:hypothetical protein
VSKQPALVRTQQIETPVDSVAHRAQAIRLVDRTAPQHRQSRVEARQQLLGGKQPNARRRQLDR